MSEAREDQSFEAACIQCEIRTGDVEGNLRRVTENLRRAAEFGASLAVLPEMWTTSFTDEYSDEMLEAAAAAEADVARLSAELDLLIVGGGPLRERHGITNRACVFDRGAVLGAYRKIHLFSPIGEHRRHVAGSEPLVLDTRLGRLGIALCYDLRFPELMRHFFVEGCELIAVPAQWPESRAEHWRVLTRARAIENQCYIVGCNSTGVVDRSGGEHVVFPGDSRIVDPTGSLVAAGAGETGPILGTIERRTVRSMRRILPIAKDRRPEIYAKLWTERDDDLPGND